MTDLARAILDAILDQADMDGGIIRSHAEERVQDVLDEHGAAAKSVYVPTVMKHYRTWTIGTTDGANK